MQVSSETSGSIRTLCTNHGARASIGERFDPRLRALSKRKREIEEQIKESIPEGRSFAHTCTNSKPQYVSVTHKEAPAVYGRSVLTKLTEHLEALPVGALGYAASLDEFVLGELEKIRSQHKSSSMVIRRIARAPTQPLAGGQHLEALATELDAVEKAAMELRREKKKKLVETATDTACERRVVEFLTNKEENRQELRIRNNDGTHRRVLLQLKKTNKLPTINTKAQVLDILGAACAGATTISDVAKRIAGELQRKEAGVKVVVTAIE
ncbi:MAG: hypothetical protein CL902_00610 [Dehalococcoidia bacterium]|nr:hypothetical protein [Dehalococcoidia bacterium]